MGERWFTELERQEETTSQDSLPGKPARATSSTARVKARLLHEALAVADGAVSEERVTIERCGLHHGDAVGVEPANDDRTLEKKVVHVAGVGERRSATLEDAAGVSSAGLAWVESQLGRRKKADGFDRFLPTEPVAVGAEWAPDVEALRQASFPGTEIDKGASSAKGKLVSVRTEDGVRVARIEVSFALKLKTVPGSPISWSRGGVFKASLVIEESLDPARREVTGKATVELAGSYEAPPARVEISTRQETTQREGLLH